MKSVHSFWYRIAALFRRSQMDTEMEEEFRAHLQMRADDLERSGLSRAEAERQARLEFGSKLGFREDCQKQAGLKFVESVFQDVRFAVRVLRKSPGFTVVAIVTLALAIGANAVVFAAINAVIVRPLNVPRAESLYSVHRLSDNSASQSYPSYVDYRDRNRSFEGLAAYQITKVALDTGGNPSPAWAIAASGNYFDVLGVQPHLGRFFHTSDEQGANSASYIVLSHAYWKSRFHSDPTVVGRKVLLNRFPYTIIGVAPRGFSGTLLFFSPDFFLPFVNMEQLDGTPGLLTSRGNRWIFMTMGHLKPGVTPEQAVADVMSISAYLEKTYPQDHRHTPLGLARPSLYGDFMGKPVKAFLTALMLLAGLILLAACANLGSLFAARASDRAREVALRLALGASRGRILRQLLTEAVLISLVGGTLGLWGSTILLRWLRAWQPFPQFPVNVPISPDVTVYVVALLLALASGLLFGIVPVRQVLRTDPYEVVKAGARSMTERRITGRDVLVAAQIAICAVLVTSSMVAVRGLVRSMNSDFGFDPREAMVVEVVASMGGYGVDAMPKLQKRMTEELESIPGVTAVGLVDWPPLSNGSLRSFLVFHDETNDLRPGNSAGSAAGYSVSPDYLRAAGTALLSGRNLTWHDDKDAPAVALVNQEFAKKILGSADTALGKNFKLKDGRRVQVVGIVEDGKYQSLTEDPKPAMFLPFLQESSIESRLIVRSSRDPQELAAAIRAKLRKLDPGLPVFLQTWTEGMQFPLFPSRVAAVSLGILGGIGAMLSITGVFGLAAYSVSRRMRELGIRMALGAQRNEVLRAALGRAFKLLAFGSAAGLILGLLATKVLAFIVYQATPRDPVVLAGAVVAMGLLGLLATWIPAQRALSIDPLVLLREE